MGGAAKAGLAVALLGIAALAPMGMSIHSSWLPPPPELPDVTDRAGIDMHLHKWEPSLGEPASLLDVLPTGSPASADFNRDGYPDLFVPSTRYTDDTLTALREPSSRLYMNDGSSTFGPRFVDVTDVAGLALEGYAYSASWGDYNNDGWPDLFVGGYRLAKLFANRGDSTFADVTTSAGLSQEGLVLGGAWGDYDRDGFLDLLLVQFADYTHPDDGLPDFHDLPGRANVLLRNSGQGAFVDASASSGLGQLARRSTSAAFVDADRDGLPDVYVTNYGQPAEYWRNNPDGTFTEEAQQAGIADGEDATCQAWEDVDRDGLLDLYVAHQEGVSDGVWLARGDGTFQGLAGTMGLDASARGRGWGCAAFDYDEDGDVDFVNVHSRPTGAMREEGLVLMNRLNEHNGLAFADNSAEACDHDLPFLSGYECLVSPLALSGLGLLDWNLDGAVDAATTGNDGDHARLFGNLGWTMWGTPPNWFKALLEGSASNRPGVGALVTVKAGNLTTVRQLGAAMGWGGQSLPEVSFGLATDAEFDYRAVRGLTVTVQWPSGAVQVVNGLSTHAMPRFYESGGWKNDTLAPRFALLPQSGTLGLHGWYTSPSVTLKLTAFDRSHRSIPSTGVQSLRYSLDGSTWVSVASPGTGAIITFDGDGVHKLWVEVADKATKDLGGGQLVSDPNKVVYLVPVRIDSTAPGSALLAPAPGTVWAQGREMARVEQLAVANRAVVIASIPTDLTGVPEAGTALQASLGGDGLQRVEALPSDAASGVWKVRYQVKRTDGQVVGDSGELRWAPYEWVWRVDGLPALEYRVFTQVTDYAGNSAESMNKVELVPTSKQGIEATPKGLSNPAPP